MGKHGGTDNNSSSGLTPHFRRGKSGGQVRDEYRDEYDPGRGGFGRAIAAERIKEEEEYGRGR